MNELKGFDLIYLATPYSKFPGGISIAFDTAARIASRLVRSGLGIYCPIVHTHPIAIHGGLDPLDHSIWLKFDAVMMQKADAMLIATEMEGWSKSIGIQHEISVFSKAGKPIYELHNREGNDFVVSFRCCK